jgi:hypothetical protein
MILVKHKRGDSCKGNQGQSMENPRKENPRELSGNHRLVVGETSRTFQEGENLGAAACVAVCEGNFA